MYSEEKYQEYLDATKDFNKNDFACITKYTKDPIKFKSYANKATKIIEIVSSLYPNVANISEAMSLARANIKEIPSCPVCKNQLVLRLESYTFKKYCSNKCRQEDIGNPAKKTISIKGTEYKSINDGIRILNLTRDNIRLNILNPNFPEWFFVNNHDKECEDMIRSIHPDLLNKELVESFKTKRIPMNKIMEDYGIKTHSTLKLVYSFHSINTKYSQIEYKTKEFLSDEESFTKEFAASTSEEMAMLHKCSPSLILQTASKYGISTTERQQSKIERDLITWVNETYPNIKVIPRDKEAIGVELDIYFPDQNFAVECDGLYHHTDLPPFDVADRMRHRYKHDLCVQKGIVLYRFTDVGETIDKLAIVKSMISNRLGKSKRVFARNCELKELTTREAKLFFIENHISGFSAARVYLGLVHDNDLIMAMSFGIPRFNKTYDWEVVRMASKLNLLVVGGAAKLLSCFRKNNIGNIMTYADLRFGNGKSYEKIGFTFVKKTSPGYFYTNMRSKFSRYQFQKSNIRKLCIEYDPTQPEVDNAFVNGYKRYWDCGNAVYELT